MQTTFSELPVNTAFTVTDTWQRDDLVVGHIYFKIDAHQARPAIKTGGVYKASTMPRITFAAHHPVTPVN